MSEENKKPKGLVNIKGKDYLQVNGRLLQFHELYPNGSISTKIISDTEHSVVMITTVVPDIKKPERYFTGIAQETNGSTFINKTSHYENCETSSRGRALAGLGIGIEESLASSEEVANAMVQQDEQKTIKAMEEVMIKFNNCFRGANQWLPLAVELKICKSNAFENSLKKIFNAKSVQQAKTMVVKIEQALVDYYNELLENEQYQRMVEAEKEKQALKSSKKEG